MGHLALTVRHVAATILLLWSAGLQRRPRLRCAAAPRVARISGGAVKAPAGRELTQPGAGAATVAARPAAAASAAAVGAATAAHPVPAQSVGGQHRLGGSSRAAAARIPAVRRRRSWRSRRQQWPCDKGECGMQLLSCQQARAASQTMSFPALPVCHTVARMHTTMRLNGAAGDSWSVRQVRSTSPRRTSQGERTQQVPGSYRL